MSSTGTRTARSRATAAGTPMTSPSSSPPRAWASCRRWSGRSWPLCCCGAWPCPPRGARRPAAGQQPPGQAGPAARQQVGREHRHHRGRQPASRPARAGQRAGCRDPARPCVRQAHREPAPAHRGRPCSSLPPRPIQSPLLSNGSAHRRNRYEKLRGRGARSGRPACAHLPADHRHRQAHQRPGVPRPWRVHRRHRPGPR